MYLTKKYQSLHVCQPSQPAVFLDSVESLADTTTELISPHKLITVCHIMIFTEAKLNSDISSTERMGRCVFLAEVFVWRVCSIITDTCQPGHSLFALLPSARRYRTGRSRTSRLRSSVFPSAVTLLNPAAR